MSNHSERGAALVIALLLLTILTLLAVTGMRTSVAEVWMAGAEQFHRRAAESASAGIEAAIARLRATGGAAAAELEGTSGDAPYTVSIRRAGTEAALPGSSAGKLVGEHLEIESTGASVRGALEVQVQGVLVISSTNGVSTFRRTGTGLGTEAGS